MIDSENNSLESKGVQGGWLTGVLVLVLYLIRHWKMIVVTTIISGIVSVVFVLCMEETFRAKSVLFLSSGPSPAGLGSLAKIAGGELGSLLSVNGSSAKDEVPVVFESEQLAIQTIQEFRLDTAWEMQKNKPIKRELLIKKWNKYFEYEVGVNDQVVVSFEDKNPVLAMLVLNAYVARVDSCWQNLKRDEARRKSQFAEERLNERMNIMLKRIDSLIAFKVHNRIYSPDDQIRQTVIAVSQLESKLQEAIVAKDIQDKTMGGALSAQLSETIALLKKQSASFSEPGAKVAGSGDASILVNLTKALPLAANIERRAQIIQLDMIVVEGLARQVEQLKIEKMRDVSILQIVDPAVIPTRRHAPPRMAIVQIFTFLGFLISCAIACGIEYLRSSAVDRVLLERIRLAWK